ncbi:MAG: hypothetical protein KC503_38295, partial [Myxococcales bacterium]|nr:hypothetical protein [Myxococcales bacterium]
MPGAKLPNGNAASDSVLVNPRRPAPPIPAKPAEATPQKPAAEKVAPTTNAAPSSASNLARPASASASNPIACAFDALKRELEQMASERDSSKKTDD